MRVSEPGEELNTAYDGAWIQKMNILYKNWKNLKNHTCKEIEAAAVEKDCVDSSDEADEDEDTQICNYQMNQQHRLSKCQDIPNISH